MSYILEALRKVEQQRDHLPVQGLSSRRRFYAAMSDSSGPRALPVMVAAAAGALVSGGLIAYLIVYSMQPVLPSAARELSPVSGAEHASFITNPHEKDQQVVARLAVMQLPETRYRTQAWEMIAQDRQQEKTKPPQSGEETKPSPEKKPDTKQPEPRPRGKRTMVAAVHT